MGRKGGLAARLIHEKFHRQALVAIETFQTFGDSDSIAIRTVLADLPFAFKALDGELDPDDAFDLRRDIVGGSVRNVPGSRRCGLVDAGEGLYVCQEPRGVFNDLEMAVGVDNRVVPCGDDLASVLLFGIPGGGDVVVRTREDCEGFDRWGEVAPLVVCTGEVASQEAVGSAFAIKNHRDMRGEKT